MNELYSFCLGRSKSGKGESARSGCLAIRAGGYSYSSIWLQCFIWSMIVEFCYLRNCFCAFWYCLQHFAEWGVKKKKKKKNNEKDAMRLKYLKWALRLYIIWIPNHEHTVVCHILMDLRVLYLIFIFWKLFNLVLIRNFNILLSRNIGTWCIPLFILIILFLLHFIV